MVGNVPELVNTLTQVVGGGCDNDCLGGEPHAADEDRSCAPDYTLYIPLQFWFNRHAGLALPLIALQYHEVKINLEFNELRNLAWSNVQKIMDRTNSAGLVAASLYVDYIYLDTEERRRFAQVAHEYLIEQLQFTGDESVTSSASKIKMSFNHPCKELIWVVQRDSFVACDGSMDVYKGQQPFNYSDWFDRAALESGYSITRVEGLAGKNPTVVAKIQLNGHDRFSEREGKYFNLVQPFQHHTNIPAVGINVYSFALNPEDHQPSGSCNMSRIDNATLCLTLSNNTVGIDKTAKVRIYAVNYNVLRVTSGMGGNFLVTFQKIIWESHMKKFHGDFPGNAPKSVTITVTLVYDTVVSEHDITEATLSNCGNVLLNNWYRPGVERSAQWHHRETYGYGKNPIGRDNPQPSPTAMKIAMDAVQRLNGSGVVQTNDPKIQSTPMETWSMRGTCTGCHPVQGRVHRVVQPAVRRNKCLPTPTKHHSYYLVFLRKQKKYIEKRSNRENFSYKTYKVDQRLFNSCKSITRMDQCIGITQQKKGKPRCWRPAGENGYCGKHQRNKVYDDGIKEGKIWCRLFYQRGCNNTLTTEEKNAGKVTCDSCILRNRGNVVMCKKEGCKFKESENGYCQKHQRHIQNDEDMKNGIRRCDIWNGCMNILTDTSKKSCEECLAKARKKDNERYAERKEIHNIIQELPPEKEGESKTQVCCYCGKDFPEYFTRYGKSSRACQGCREKQQKEDEKRKDRVRNYRKEMYNNLKIYYESYIRGAKKRSYDFTLSEEKFTHLVTMESCYYCGIRKIGEVIGVDRVDNTICYTDENCVACCDICNQMKWDYHPLFLIEKCRMIISNTAITPDQITKWKVYYNRGKQVQYFRYVDSAIDRDIPFELSPKQFNSLIRQPCYLCGFLDAKLNGIDRVDSSKGYSLENCRGCCTSCNTMKLDSSLSTIYEKAAMITAMWTDTTALEEIPIPTAHSRFAPRILTSADEYTENG